MAKKLTRKQKTKAQFQRSGKKMVQLGKSLGAKLPSGLRFIGEEIMLDVKASRPGSGVPVDRGPLRASGRVDGPTSGRVTLSFGGASAKYALIQHENTKYRHRVGESRYLVRGVERWRKDGVSARRALAELQQAIDAVAIGRGGGSFGPASSRAGSFST